MKIFFGVSKKREVIEPSKYYTHVGEKIIKYQKGKKIYFKHLNKNKKIIAEFGEKKLIKKFEFTKTQKKVLFKKLFQELEKFSKQKNYQFYKNEFKKDKKNLEKIYKKPPIIIGGCGRSGTTLLLSILSAHRDIEAIDEETYCFTPNFLRFKNIHNYIGLKKNKKCWMEKTPKNILVFDKIYNFFDGNVKLIHIVRNPQDVVQSKHPNSKKKHYIPLARWEKEVGLAKKFKNICLTVKFEDLISDFKNEIKKILKYLNLRYDNRMMRYIKYSQVKKNIAWGDERVKELQKLYLTKKHNAKVVKELEANKSVIKLMRYYGYK